MSVRESSFPDCPLCLYQLILDSSGYQVWVSTPKSRQKLMALCLLETDCPGCYRRLTMPPTLEDVENAKIRKITKTRKAKARDKVVRSLH